MKAASAKEALNLNNSEYFVTPYTLGLVLKSSNSGGGYRIGDVIISVNEENPSVKYGGKWELLCPGRTLVCIDTSQSEFNSVLKTGGSKYMQVHSHSFNSNKSNTFETLFVSTNSFRHFAEGSGGYGIDGGYASIGESGTGDSGNLQPYMVVYMWVRVS